MDYVAWCDAVAEAIADHAERNHQHANLQQVAAEIAEARGYARNSSAWQSAVLAGVEVCRAVGVGDRGPLIRFRLSQIAALRAPYDRWMQACRVPLDPQSVALLATLNRLSQSEGAGFVAVDHVELGTILSALREQGTEIERDTAEELLDALASRGLANGDRAIGRTRFKSTYLGVAHTERAQVAEDREIDALRTEGEGGALDYKRAYYLDRKGDRESLAKDVTALANAGGTGPRYLLLGVENDGTFYLPATAEEAAQHRAALDAITVERLQQIVGSRTTHTPALRIVRRGEHRDGPYVVVAVEREVEHLPYRVFAGEGDRTAPNAHELGRVWIRKGAINGEASLEEIRDLEAQAALRRRIVSGEGA